MQPSGAGVLARLATHPKMTTKMCSVLSVSPKRVATLDQGRRQHGNEIPWQCSGRSSGELSGPFCLETPHFHVRYPQIVRNCSRERSFEHCHSHAFISGGKKDPQSQKIARTAPKNLLNNSRGLLAHYPVKQGFRGKSHQKVHPNVLCHTVSLWYLFCTHAFLVPNLTTGRSVTVFACGRRWLMHVPCQDLHDGSTAILGLLSHGFQVPIGPVILPGKWANNASPATVARPWNLCSCQTLEVVGAACCCCCCCCCCWCISLGTHHCCKPDADAVPSPIVACAVATAHCVYAFAALLIPQLILDCSELFMLFMLLLMLFTCCCCRLSGGTKSEVVLRIVWMGGGCPSDNMAESRLKRSSGGR